LEYNVNPSALGAVFMLPCEVVDKHIKLAGAVQLKVLLWAMRNINQTITAEKIAEALGLPTMDVADALLYWTESGIMASNQPIVTPAKKVEEEAPKRVAKTVAAIKPTREEVAKRGNESEEIAFLLREAQMKFGRGLRQNEVSTLVWLHDDEGMGIALILMLIEFAKSEERCNIGYIERTATDWINSGISTIVDAEQRICEIHAQRNSWRRVSTAMGIEYRRPSEKELKITFKWVDEWAFSMDMLREAYDECVNNTSKFSMPYINKILESWHKQGIKTMEDIKNAEAKKKPDKGKNSYAGYDLDVIERLLQGDEE